MEKVIIFGLDDMAQLAHYYLKNDSNYEVVAFITPKVSDSLVKSFCSLPVVDFTNIEKKFSNKEYAFFAPVSSEKMNTIKEKVYDSIKYKGYKMISYVSSKTIIYNTEVGENCFIQAGNIF